MPKRKPAVSAAEAEATALATFEGGEAPTTSGAFDSSGMLRGCAGYYAHFIADGILPAFTPSVELRVTYPSGAGDWGTQMEIKGPVRRAPIIVAWGPPPLGREAKQYTLLFADPDQPSPYTPTQRSLLLWLVTNVPSGGSTGGRLSLSHSTEVVPFMAPKPVKSSHRLLFLLCEQGNGEVPPGVAPSHRESFNITAFLNNHGLVPVGINFVCVHPEY